MYNTITLWQPYASLIACGAKTIETRSWAPPDSAWYEPLYIHAGRHWPTVDDQPPMVSWEWTLAQPRGAIVARCILTGWAQVKRLHSRGHAGVSPIADIHRNTGQTSPKAREHEIDIGRVQTDRYGDFSPGRWLWMLDDIQKIYPPIPAQGRQRIWQWEPPTDWHLS